GVRRYMARMVVEPAISVVASFDGSAERLALQRFVAMCAAPLVVLVLLLFSAWRFIQDDVLRGIAGIEKAALAEGDGRHGVLAPVDVRMPDDIRRVAKAFNRMVTAAATREASLRKALETNENLMRELHHRVKNSLQVIQSYLALTRRSQPGKGGEILRETEGQVQVLAIAYRFAMTNEGMMPVPLAPFIQELLLSMGDAAHRSGQSIAANIHTDASLPVDRAIPLGLVIVEESFALLKDADCKAVRVTLGKADSGSVRLAISADGIRLPDRPLAKTLKGLQMQLGATELPAPAPTVLAWDIAVGDAGGTGPAST
ncbi:MAG: sensor histidine kinase, partial [Beijerinckiaceae bacterium]